MQLTYRNPTGRERIISTEIGQAPSISRYLDQLNESLLFKDANTDGSLKYYVAFYHRSAPRKSLAFQVAGSLVIVFSVALPVVAAFGNRLLNGPDGYPKDFLVSVIAAAIALLSGFNTFFRWDTGWRGHIGAELALRQLQAEWEAKKAAALVQSDPQKGLALITEATDRLIVGAHEIIKAETDEFFKAQKFPDSKTAHEVA